LISCAPEVEQEVLAILQAGDFMKAQKIGQFNEGSGLSVS
jgi:hypothetical protein